MTDKRYGFLELLKDVKQPQRYLSPEIGAVLKDKFKIRGLLVFPDLYEIGMAHYGFQLLYFLGNSIEDVYIERGFLPWFDLKELMEKNGIPLLSYETGTPANKFSFLAFTLPTPQHFTNLIYGLDISKIPLKWKERSEKDPIIIAGGMALSNPSPLLDILDVIALGDGEILFPKILEVFKEEEKREKRLWYLSKIDGILVPPLKKEKTRKVFLKDLKNPFLFKPILPSYPSVHHRFNIEIMRGCPWGCRFCQAGFWYRPYREADLKKVYEFLIKEAPGSGFTEIGLLSLSSSDINFIYPFCQNLLNKLEKYHISLSMPSLRVDSISFPLIETLQRVRKSSLTFAPETGENLRLKINKPIKDEEIIEILKKAKGLGWKKIKFYFMLGLPFEKEEDLKDIVYLFKEVKKIGFPSVNLNISNFVPKPWTPFQNHKMPHLKEFYEKQVFLKKNLPYKAKFTKPEISFIEERISRGGEELGNLLIEAYRKGHFFDAWDEYIKFEEYLNIL
ncbi:MAG: radical SAM protein, partial [Thermoanaerobaculia bacterium]